jgi:pimeloyl-ACP methyl ester carboxylesterase
MAQAIDYLEDLLEDEGPFDGIFGFSQGAALTLSYFYRQQAATNPFPVKFACLFSTAMPCSPDVDMGDAIISKLQALEYDITDLARCNGKDLTIAEHEFVDILQQTIVNAATHNSLLPRIDMNVYRYGEREAIPRIMYPSLLAQKIQVPTIHVWGQNDSQYMIKMAEVARSICDESRVKTVLHAGLHDVPKRQTDIKAVLRTIDWAVVQA